MIQTKYCRIFLSTTFLSLNSTISIICGFPYITCSLIKSFSNNRSIIASKYGIMCCMLAKYYAKTCLYNNINWKSPERNLYVLVTHSRCYLRSKRGRKGFIKNEGRHYLAFSHSPVHKLYTYHPLYLYINNFPKNFIIQSDVTIQVILHIYNNICIP